MTSNAAGGNRILGALRLGGEYRFASSPADRKAPGAWKRANRRGTCGGPMGWASQT
jgi:hypothetical protein